MGPTTHYDSIVIGGGPAGLSAGIYLSRARLKTLILNEGTIGGQMVLTHEIANYPGVDNTSGYQLALNMKKQAQAFGCEIKANVTLASLELKGEVKKITLDDGTVFTSDSVIVSPGGRSRTLGIPGEDALKGKGISYCATCDGDFFTDKEIIVVGGGNSALEEAVSLTKYARKVTIVHQFDHFQAFEHAVQEATSHPKIAIKLGTVLTAFHGSDKLEGVSLKQLKSGKTESLPIDGTFIFIGYLPNTEFLQGVVNLNERGEIVVGQDMSTSVPGVYAAGDSIVKRYRQVTTAVADGTIAALAVSEYLHNKKQVKTTATMAA